MTTKAITAEVEYGYPTSTVTCPYDGAKFLWDSEDLASWETQPDFHEWHLLAAENGDEVKGAQE